MNNYYCMIFVGYMVGCIFWDESEILKFNKMWYDDVQCD